MLPLDGGHVAIAVYEKIRTGRSTTKYHADVAKLLPYTWAMVAFLGILFATTLLTDLLHPMANPVRLTPDRPGRPPPVASVHGRHPGDLTDRRPDTPDPGG